MTFYRWLMKQTKRDDPIGDLARDVKADTCWPKRASRIGTMQEHLHEHGAMTSVYLALDRAMMEHRS